MSYLNFLLPFPMCITEHLLTSKSICQSLTHLYILLRSSLIMPASSSVTTYLHSFKPFTPRMMTLFRLSVRCVSGKGPTCSCDRVTSDTVELTCSTIYADSTFDPVAAIFTLYVDGNAVLSDTPQRTSCDGYTWISASSFTTAYSSSSTYECGQTFGQPTEVLDPSVSMNAPEFNQKCPVTASGEFRTNSSQHFKVRVAS